MPRRAGKQPQHQPSPAPSQSARGPDVAPARPQGAAPSAAPTDELGQLTSQSPVPSSSKATRFPDRPDFGRNGIRVDVRANHFLVDVVDRVLYHYDVSITPEVKSKKINRDVMRQLVQMYGVSHMNRRIPAFDGRKILFTADPLPFESEEFVVKLVAKDEPGSSSASTRNKSDREFKVTISHASKADIHHLLEFINRRQLDNPQETIQALDVVLRASPSEKYTVVGRSFFSPSLDRTGELGGGIKYWRGYYQSLRPTQMGLSLNIDVSARPFYENIYVTEFISKHFNFDFSRFMSDQDRIKIERALRRLKVELDNGRFTKSYIITGLSKEPLSHLMLTLDDQGNKKFVVQYFYEKYNIGLGYLSHPALQAGNDADPIYLPIELCKIAAGQRYSKKLNERQVNALLTASCLAPREKEMYIRGMARRNDFNRDRLLQEFGIKVSEELALCDARVLPPPKLQYHDTGEEPIFEPSRGQWNMIGKKMYKAGNVQYWSCLNFSTQVRRDLVPVFCRELRIMCTSKGLVFNEHPSVDIKSADPNTIERALSEVCRQAGKRKLQLLIIILPDKNGSYAKIKRICETQLGIVSQCTQANKVLKFQKRYFENLALKINVKVGGCNTVLLDAVDRRIPIVTTRPTIIFGADVTHPQPGEDSSPSIAAVVASMDWPNVTKYRGIVSAQSRREEIIQDLFKTYEDPDKGVVNGGMIRELILAFSKSNNCLPGNIIFYRDGVGEGQFNQVLSHELLAIRKACASIREKYMPKVTLVVVQKRHHTRFFPVGRGDPKTGNISPGTVVDTRICHPREFDFYMNSHASIMGTSRPTHYHVLHDDNNFNADQLQTLTNNLCYTCARCTRSVSIVPPAYYAHLAAFRARYYIEGETSDVDSGSGSRSTNVAVTLPAIIDNVKDVMFYC